MAWKNLKSDLAELFEEPNYTDKINESLEIGQAKHRAQEKENSRHRAHSIIAWGKKHFCVRDCALCGKEFSVKNHNKTVKFCSHSCGSTSGRKTYSLNGETMSLKSWAKKFYISEVTVRQRLKRGLTLQAALTMPIRGKSFPITDKGCKVGCW